jgi:hypothetical protein
MWQLLPDKNDIGRTAKYKPIVLARKQQSVKELANSAEN